MKEELVVLVNEKDEVLGTLSKTEAHEKGLLHRAISVILYDSSGKMLIQQRAMSKYHWAGIWSNACCSHPREGEAYYDCAMRRLGEELNIYTELRHAFSFIYKAYDEGSGLTEHELDHVFIGYFDEEINFNHSEVKDIEWKTTEEIEAEIQSQPEKYSFWFKIILEKLKLHKK